MSAATLGPQQSASRALEVLIVGAGFGGIAAAIELSRRGITNITILEKAAELGGTWFYNSYPGAACDVPSHLYSFSYAQRRDWSRLCSPQPEIRAYLGEVARAYGIDRLVQTSTTVTDCAWDAERCRWSVQTAEGPGHEADVLVIATGQLDQPARPDIDGAESFAGHSFHSAEWDHDYPLAGKRVAVIGDWRQRRPVRARDRARGGAPECVPAHGQLVPAAAQPPLQPGDQSGDRTRPRAAGAAAQVRVRVHGVADARDPPPAHRRASRRRALRRLHALTAEGPRAPREGVARLHVRLQADPLQLALPAGARAGERRARHRCDRAHHTRPASRPPAARSTTSTA